MRGRGEGKRAGQKEGEVQAPMNPSHVFLGLMRMRGVRPKKKPVGSKGER